MKTKYISIAKDFSPFPAGRYEKDGPNTGEGFRKKILVKSFSDYDRVVINLDGAVGYGSSFLEEAFGGLVREEGFTADEIMKKINLEGKRQSVIDAIITYVKKAQEVKNSGE